MCLNSTVRPEGAQALLAPQRPDADSHTRKVLGVWDFLAMFLVWIFLLIGAVCDARIASYSQA